MKELLKILISVFTGIGIAAFIIYCLNPTKCNFCAKKGIVVTNAKLKDIKVNTILQIYKQSADTFYANKLN